MDPLDSAHSLEMFRKHAWESSSDDDHPSRRGADAAGSASARHDWEASSGGGSPGGTTSDEDERLDPGTTPGTEFVNFVNELYLLRKLSARDMCLLCHYASSAGIREATPHARRPGLPSGHYQRALSSSLPYLRERDRLYEIDVPSYSSDAMSRATVCLTMIPPHEALADCIGGDGTSLEELRSAISGRELPECYYEHPVVQGSADPVWPISVFIDGVPYSQTDGVIGCWVCDELSGKRALVFGIRKKSLCECGCRGWCSIDAALRFLRWSLEACAAGRYPTARHDGHVWRASDKRRAACAGQPLPVRTCVLYIKADWAEISTTMGFPSWNSSLRPCFYCNASGDSLYKTDGLSAIGLPWRSNLPGEYEEACARCEMHVVLSKPLHEAILNALVWDKRKDGSRGRALRHAIPQARLRAGDRLEPAACLLDVGEFDQICVFPHPVVFWRPTLETLARHRNPLFSQALGLTPGRSMTVDVLHALHLGVLNGFCKHALWHMLLGGAWGRRETVDETSAAAVLQIRHELRVFYREWDRTHPAGTLTRIGHFSKRVIGDAASRKLTTKGAETWGFLLFLEAQMASRPFEGKAPFRRAAQALIRMIQCWASEGRRLRPAAIQLSWDCWNSFLHETQGMGLEIPKRHLVAHLLERAPFWGNPRAFAAWVDEAWNRELKLACRSVSQQTFEPFLLLRMREILRKGQKRPL